MSAHEGTQHPISVYLWIWLLLFVLSAFSYMVDYLHVQGLLRWTLILVFMFLKAGLIVARLSARTAAAWAPIAVFVVPVQLKVNVSEA